MAQHEVRWKNYEKKFCTCIVHFQLNLFRFFAIFMFVCVSFSFPAVIFRFRGSADGSTSGQVYVSFDSNDMH